VRDRGDLAAVHVEPDTQPLPRCVGHDDHLIRHGRDRLENRTLVWRRIFEDCVGNDDRRHSQPVDDVHHVVSVDTTINSILMLDDRDVVLIQQLAARCYGCRRTAGQLADHPLVRGRSPVSNAYDTHIDAIRGQGVGQSSGERRQSAMRGRIGTEDAGPNDSGKTFRLNRVEDRCKRGRNGRKEGWSAQGKSD
jgi:hypothetical protein